MTPPCVLSSDLRLIVGSDGGLNQAQPARRTYIGISRILKLLPIFGFKVLQPSHDFHDRIWKWTLIVGIEPLQPLDRIFAVFVRFRDFRREGLGVLANQAAVVAGQGAEIGRFKECL